MMKTNGDLEYYKSVKNKIMEMLLEGFNNSDIISYFDRDIKEKKISLKAIYKYIGEIKSKYIKLLINKYMREGKIPQKSLFVVEFLLKWSEVFQEEVNRIFENPNIKRKVPTLETYLKNLERVYNLLEKILPNEENRGVKINDIDTMPIKKVDDIDE